MEKKFVIALGGSVAFPQEINTAFLKKFYLFIRKETKKGNKFIIVCGGGNVCRKYINAASKITRIPNEDRDWIGIHATRLNAHFLRTLFKEEANPVVFDKRFKIRSFGRYPIIIGSGWSPGWSTDFVSVQTAADFKINKIIILGKPDFVYADFGKEKKGKPIKKISWKNYFKLIPSKWTPGMHAPVDPVAARMAKKQNIEAVVAEGKDIINFGKILRGGKFKGTILANFK